MSLSCWLLGNLIDFGIVTHPLAFLQVSPTERLVMLNGVQDNTDLLALQNDDVTLQQPVSELSALFKQHRIQAESLLIYALLGLAIILGLVYGKRSVMPLVLPVSLALLSTFAVHLPKCCQTLGRNDLSALGAPGVLPDIASICTQMQQRHIA